MQQPNLKKLFKHAISEEEKKMQVAMILVVEEKESRQMGIEL
jgi:hypothetical protein